MDGGGVGRCGAIDVVVVDVERIGMDGVVGVVVGVMPATRRWTSVWRAL